MEAEYGEIQDPIRETKKGIKTVTQGNKSSVLAAAEEMQKIRDNDMGSTKPIGGGMFE
jgi:hypothetical protein